MIVLLVFIFVLFFQDKFCYVSIFTDYDEPSEEEKKMFQDVFTF